MEELDEHTVLTKQIHRRQTMSIIKGRHELLQCYSVTPFGINHMQIHVPCISIDKLRPHRMGENTAGQEWEVSLSFEESLSR